MDPTQVSRNNGFFVSIGVLDGGRKKSLTAAGRELAKALDYEMPDQIEAAWYVLAQDNDFLRKIVSAVRIRGGMDLSSLRNHVAFTAGQPKSPRILTGAGSVVDVLKAAGLLREDGGKIFATDKMEPGVTPQPSPAGAPSPTVQGTERVEVPLPSSVVATTLSIEVKIDCRPDDLAELGPPLHAHR